jgi:uncharacterized protein with PIN domain
VKFVVDGMLGSLARWLRMMGHDVEYSRASDDDTLMAFAKEDHRVLLTRDLELYRRSVAKGVDVFYVEGRSEAERLAALAEKFQIKLDIDLKTSKCPKCNVPVRPVPKECIADRVETNTFSHYDEFWECPRCKKVYWQGAHWPKIRATLEDARNRVSSRSGV